MMKKLMCNVVGDNLECERSRDAQLIYMTGWVVGSPFQST